MATVLALVAFVTIGSKYGMIRPTSMNKYKYSQTRNEGSSKIKESVSYTCGYDSESDCESGCDGWLDNGCEWMGGEWCCESLWPNYI